MEGKTNCYTFYWVQQWEMTEVIFTARKIERHKVDSPSQQQQFVLIKTIFLAFNGSTTVSCRHKSLTVVTDNSHLGQKLERTEATHSKVPL